MTEWNPSDERSILPQDLADLVDRVAAYPYGLGFLHLAPLETVAINLKVSPYVVDRARSLLMTAGGRARLIAEVRKAKARIPVASSPPGEPASATPTIAATAEELVQRALEHPLGLRFLLDAPMEVAAVTLRAHVFLVLEARDLLRDRFGMESHPGEDGES